MNGIWIFDIEGDSLKPTKIHCLAACQPKGKEVFATTNYDDMRKFLLNAKVLIGHNIARWDIPVLERLLDIKITAKIVDTLALSWYLYPERNKPHGLDDWGQDLGIPKPIIHDWENLSIEEYIHRCKEDVRINTKLWNQMYIYLLDIYGKDKDLWKLLDYLEFKMYCARLQEESKWKLDVEFVKKNLEEMEAEKEAKTQALSKAMPRVPEIQEKSRPKVFIKKNGDFSSLGLEWIKLLTEKGLPPDYDGVVEIVKGYEDGNPSSPQQLKDWLYSLGWKPRTFKHQKHPKTGEQRSIPQINLEHGKGICDSIKELYDKEPNLELLDGLSVLQHRIGILKGFLRDQEDGYLMAQIAGFTNTLRVKHTTIVNLPKVDKLYAKPVRSSLIARDGRLLCGSDMSSLEDRIKQHFIFPHDPEYVHSMNKEDWDPHIEVAVLAGMLTKEQGEAYKAGEKKYKPVRDIAKNGNYACQYGAGAPRLVVTCGISHDQALQLHKAYWEMNWAIKKVASEQVFKIVNDQMWLFNPISRLWYSLRFEKDIFSTLVQGTASYVFDMWLKKILDKRPQLTGQFHDEFILEITEGYEEECEKLIRSCIAELNEELKLNRELGCDVQFDQRYSGIH